MAGIMGLRERPVVGGRARGLACARARGSESFYNDGAGSERQACAAEVASFREVRVLLEIVGLLLCILSLTPCCEPFWL